MMEKKSIVLLFIFAIMLIMICKFVNAGLGITPAITHVDFQPNFSFFVNFGVLMAEPDQKLHVSAEGDFNESVKFDKTNITGPEGFTAYIDFPLKAEKPGSNRLTIFVEQDLGAGSSGIGTKLRVGSLILIKVPYPGKYIAINKFEVNNINAGETVNYKIGIDSLGYDSVLVSPVMKVYRDNELIEEDVLEPKLILNQSYYEYDSNLKNKYPAGVYNVSLFVSYVDNSGAIKVLNESRELKVGSLFVDILGCNNVFNKSKINPVYIDIESKWNNDIDGIYAAVNITSSNGSIIDYFKTSPVKLIKWQKAQLNGFFNAENAKEGNYKANVTLNYLGASSSKIFDITVVSIKQGLFDSLKEMNMMTVIIIILSMLVFIMFIALLIIIFYLLRQNAPQKSRRS